MPAAFNWDIVRQHWPAFVAGAGVDLELALLSFVCACAIGVVVAMLRLSGIRALAVPAFAYVQVMRGIPLYVFLLWVYFGVAALLGTLFSPFQAALIALTLTESGYTAEIFRAGIAAIDRGHVEAAQSLGMSHLTTYRTVILPQALRIVLPPLGNVCIGAVKAATIVSIISVTDMVYVAQDLNARYFIPFQAYTAVALLLIAMVFGLGLLFAAAQMALRVP